MATPDVKRIFEAALRAHPTHFTAYESLMVRLMDDLCIRTTLLLLKESWKRILDEFGMGNDIDAVREILRHFPDIISFDSWINEDEISFTSEDMDVRSMALNVFGKIWDAAQSFFNTPPHTFYEKSHIFFSAKLKMLRSYHYDLNVQAEVQVLIGFGKEERQWIQVDHWRNVYIKRLEEYFEGQSESWRLCTAINHDYFQNGMKKAMQPPVCITTTDLADESIILMYIPDNKLKEEARTKVVELELERRECAKETLKIIAYRWGVDQGLNPWHHDGLF